MKNKTILFLLPACMFIFGVANAQEIQQDTIRPVQQQATGPIQLVVPASEFVPTKEVAKVKKDKKNSISVYGGLPGYAVGYGRKLNHHFTARVNYATFTISQNLENLTFSDREVNATVDFDYQALDFFIDYLPSKGSSFKFVVGASYLSNMETTILLEAASGLQYGDITLSKEQIGDILINAKWSGISPYVAIGFGRTVPKRRVGFGLEVGGHFLGKSDFTFNATKSLVPLNETENESKDFEKFIDAITFLPTVQFHLNFKF